MPAKSFGQFLLERGVITQEMLLAALEYQRSRIKPVCDLAVKTGREKREELAALRRGVGEKGAQAEQTLRDRIQSLAELEASWRSLSERGVFLVEALVRDGRLRREELDRLQEDYRRSVAGPHIDLQHVVPFAPETRHLLESLIEVALDLFAHYVGEVPEVLALTQSLAEGGAGGHAFAQAIAGDVSVHYVMVLPSPVLEHLARAMLGAPVQADDALCLDAVAEFLNVVVGNVCTKFSMRGHAVHASVPARCELKTLVGREGKKLIITRARVSSGEFLMAYVW